MKNDCARSDLGKKKNSDWTGIEPATAPLEGWGSNHYATSGYTLVKNFDVYIFVRHEPYLFGRN